MKLLIIQTPSFNPNNGGVQRITYNLGEYFVKKKYDVSYFSFMATDHIDSEYGKLFYPTTSGVKNNIEYLKDVIKKIKPEVIINQMPYKKEISYIMQTCSQQGIKTYGCIHNSLFSFKSNAKYIIKQNVPKLLANVLIKAPFYNLVQANHKRKHHKDLKLILKHHDTLILYTPPNLKELEYFLSVEDLKDASIDFMPNPVNITNFDLPVKEKIILHVGRINNMQKRSDLLLEFWEHVNKELPEWKFQIIGDGPFMKDLKADLNKRNLKNVEILGYQKPEAYFKKASIFMMPSAYEGFPNTVIEAQIYGCPVLAFDSYAAISWIVNNEKDAFLAKAFDSYELAQKCIKLAKNERMLDKMKIAAQQNATKFTLDRIGKQWEKLFQK